MSAAEPGAGYISRDNIIFHNTGAVDEIKLRACLPDSVHTGSVLSFVDSLQKLKHAGLGFHSARITRHEWRQAPSANGHKRLEIWIDKGRPAKLGNLSFTGLSRAEESRLRHWIGPVPGSPASDMAVERILRRVVVFHADRGHPYCAARIQEARLDSNSSLILTIRVDKGRPVSLGRIEFKGVSNTRPEVLGRLARLKEGSPYSETQIQAARARLLRSGLFGSVGEPLVLSTVNPHRVNLSLAVRELPSNHIEAALGSGGGSGSGTLAGFVRLHLGNLFGTARACLIDWERPRRGWSSLQLEYHEPWLLGKNLSLGLAYNQQVRDSTFTTSSGRVRLSRDFTERLVLGLGAGYEKTSPGSETYLGAESSSHWSVSGNLDWTNVLRPQNPRSGLELNLSAETGRRKLDGKNLREVRLRVYSAGYLPLKRLPHQAALGIGYAQVSIGGSSVPEIPYHARLAIGGEGGGAGPRATVRGHIEEAWRGKRIAWANLEYRYLMGENSRLFVFYDIGAARVPRPSAPGETGAGWRTQSLQGFGAGIQLETRLGLMGMALAFNPDRGLGDGRVHLRLAERF